MDFLPNIESSTIGFEENIKKKPFPNLNQSWLLFGVFLGASLILGIFAGIMYSAAVLLGFSSPDVFSWAALISYLLTFAAVVAFAYLYADRKDCELKLIVKPASYRLFAILLFFMPALTILLDAFISMYDLIPLPYPLDQIVEKFRESIQDMVKLDLASFLTAVIAAPILEEILCRGIILDGLLKTRDPKSAILWSAFIFAALHMNPWQGTAAFAIGCVTGWIYWKTRSLWACIFIHFVNNAFVFGSLFLTDDPRSGLGDIAGEYYPLLTATALFVACVTGYIIYSELKDRKIIYE